MGESSILKLIIQTHNLWNPRLGFNKESQLPTNLILEDEIEKKSKLKNLPKKKELQQKEWGPKHIKKFEWWHDKKNLQF
jgi:hypothetical protein